MPSESRDPYDVGSQLVGSQLVRLARLCGRLRIIGLSILLAAILSVVCFVLGIAFIRNHYYNSGQPLLLGAAGIGTLGLFLTAIFDVFRRNGDAIFAVLTEEVQFAAVKPQLEFDDSKGWNMEDLARFHRELGSSSFIMRQYSAAADLPLVPGRFGAAIFAGLFLVIILISALQIPYA
jgi:hypothetical protein